MSSRTQVARFLAQELADASPAERTKLIQRTASWLKMQNQTKGVDHLVQDIASALSDTGYLFATVTTARDLTPSQQARIEQFLVDTLAAKSVEVVYRVDSKLIGGIRIETPRGTFDDSVQAKLNRMLENIG